MTRQKKRAFEEMTQNEYGAEMHRRIRQRQGTEESVQRIVAAIRKACQENPAYLKGMVEACKKDPEHGAMLASRIPEVRVMLESGDAPK